MYEGVFWEQSCLSLFQSSTSTLSPHYAVQNRTSGMVSCLMWQHLPKTEAHSQSTVPLHWDNHFLEQNLATNLKKLRYMYLEVIPLLELEHLKY